MAEPNAPLRGGPWWQILAAVVLLVLLWQLRGALMLIFAAVVVAATLRALADPLVDQRVLGTRAAVLVIVLLLLLFAGVGVWQLGTPFSEQLEALRTSVPQAWRALLDWLQSVPLGRRILESLDDLGGQVPWANLAGIATSTVRTLTALVLILLLGIYLAIDLELYRDGVLRLVPQQRRPRLGDALDAAGHALKRWLLGQAVGMVLIGLAVTVGLSLLGMPMALALGVIAGLFEFVPYVGPIVAGALSVLVAFTVGPQQALYVAVLFIAMQQVQGSILMPLVQRWAVRLPPVLGLLAMVVFGTLFGPMGVALGTPLMVVAMVLVQRLYVEPLNGG